MVRVDFVDHILQFLLGRILTQRAHDFAQLIGGDGSRVVFVEQAEDVFEGLDLLVRELLDGCLGARRRLNPRVDWWRMIARLRTLVHLYSRSVRCRIVGVAKQVDGS